MPADDLSIGPLRRPLEPPLTRIGRSVRTAHRPLVRAGPVGLLRHPGPHGPNVARAPGPALGLGLEVREARVLLLHGRVLLLHGPDGAFAVTGSRGVLVADRGYDGGGVDAHLLLLRGRDLAIRMKAGHGSRRPPAPGAVRPTAADPVSPTPLPATLHDDGKSRCRGVLGGRRVRLPDPPDRDLHVVFVRFGENAQPLALLASLPARTVAAASLRRWGSTGNPVRILKRVLRLEKFLLRSLRALRSCVFLHRRHHGPPGDAAVPRRVLPRHRGPRRVVPREGHLPPRPDGACPLRGAERIAAARVRVPPRARARPTRHPAPEIQRGGGTAELQRRRGLTRRAGAATIRLTPSRIGR